MKEHNTTEQWRDIHGYEDLYQVSNMGKIRSLRSGIRLINPNNRLHVCLSEVRAAGDGSLHGHDGPRVRKVLLCTAYRRAARQQVHAQPRRRAQAQPQHGAAPRPF